MEYYSVIKETIDTHKNLEESPENYGEWKMPIPKDNIPYDSIYITVL